MADDAVMDSAAGLRRRLGRLYRFSGDERDSPWFLVVFLTAVSAPVAVLAAVDDEAGTVTRAAAVVVCALLVTIWTCFFRKRLGPGPGGRRKQ